MVADNIQVFLIRQNDGLELATSVGNGAVSVHLGAAVAYQRSNRDEQE